MIPGDPKQLEILTVLSSWVESPLILRRRRLFAMHKYGKVKSFRLVKHIGKGFAIALLEGASRGYAFVEYEPEKELCRAYEWSLVVGKECSLVATIDALMDDQEMDLVVGKNLDNFVLEDEKDLFVLPLLSFF
ncbi:hypothetical protein Bca101_072647 [Brassica carinata]